MKNIIIKLIIAMLVLSSCNDSFLDRLPVEDLTEETSFETYDNFKTYAWSLYDVFENDNILKRLGDSASEGLYESDQYAGYLSNKGVSSYNPYAFQTIVNSTTGNGWDFSYIRKVNVMLENIESSSLSEADKEHWRSVGYFFRSYYYMELIARFGDVPWLEHVLTDDDEALYAARTPRKEVADKVLENLQYAETHIKEGGDGANTINRHCIRALISRFTLFEGTWRKYHGLGDETEYLQECVRVSEELMKVYPTLHSDWGEEWTSPDLSVIPGIIFYKEYIAEIITNRYSHLERNQYHGVEMPQLTVDMYLCQDGKPISGSAVYEWGKKDKSIYSVFRHRDHRLLETVAPPYELAATSSEASWDYHSNPAYREYIDMLGPNFVIANPGEQGKHKILPLLQWSGRIVLKVPNITTKSKQQILTCRGGYYVYRNYCVWDENSNKFAANVADKPIFKIDEVLLNYAEAMYELGRFTQDVADRTINKLRPRANVADMKIAEINDSFDPKRDKTVEPLLWEIRRERIIELMGEGFGFYDVRRWKKADYFVNRPQYGMWATREEIGTGKIYNSETGLPDQSAPEGYIYLFNDPLKEGKGWLDKYYLYMIPSNDIILNPNLVQNPGWN
ncbi:MULTISPECIES: RagB/SusD family nutrient uptake outer membrane protein [Parabacteroides]|uniref:RagB/SusD family nutrient uptake outer membrane protein n=1 Tax=Parabacteroides leei TaxID=2939491 RepID=UPI00189805AA|nr:RagB/SusD family nutrient uptake outer membrane protein [Parabacteroides goldsteinii]